MLLREFQNYFKEFILAERCDVLMSLVQENNLHPKKRLGIYRNNVNSHLNEALAIVFPSVKLLIGESCFNFVAHEYIKMHPSKSGDIKCFGNFFADFLSNVTSLQELSYLPDIARLEWFFHEIFHEEEEAQCSLYAIDEKLRVAKTTRLLRSEYPILKIWKMCMEPSNRDSTINLGDKGDNVLIIRRDSTIHFESLNDIEFVLLDTLESTYNLKEACAAALNLNVEFDLKVFLEHHISIGTIVAI